MFRPSHFPPADYPSARPPGRERAPARRADASCSGLSARWFGALLVITTACERVAPSAPDKEPLRAANTSTSVCPDANCLVLFSTSKPLIAAAAPTDSSGAIVDLGSVLVRGVTGDSVALLLSADPSAINAAGPTARLLVRAGQQDAAATSYPFAVLAGGVTVLRFARADTVRLFYALARPINRVPNGAAVQLRQRLLGSATVVEARTPWAQTTQASAVAARMAALNSASAGSLAMIPGLCMAVAPGAATGCPDIVVGMAPYAQGAPFGDFQSQSGTGASARIRITFSRRVKSVTVTAEDPTFPGNRIIAYGDSGVVVASTDFASNGQAGVYSTSTVTVVAPNDTIGISAIDLVPAGADYVAYSELTFTPLEGPDSCSTFKNPLEIAGDPLLSDLDVQRVFKRLADSTGWGLPLKDRKEQGGFFGRQGTELRFFPYDRDLSSLCTSGVPISFEQDSIVGKGYVVVGRVHTHPTAGGTSPNPGNCFTSDGKGGYAPVPISQFPKLQFGDGPSTADLDPWLSQNAPSYPGYVIDPKRVYRYRLDASGKLKQNDFTINKCVGGQS